MVRLSVPLRRKSCPRLGEQSREGRQSQEGGALTGGRPGTVPSLGPSTRPASAIAAAALSASMGLLPHCPILSPPSLRLSSSRLLPSRTHPLRSARLPCRRLWHQANLPLLRPHAQPRGLRGRVSRTAHGGRCGSRRVLSGSCVAHPFGSRAHPPYGSRPGPKHRPHSTLSARRPQRCAARWPGGSSRAHAATAVATGSRIATTRAPYASPTWSRAAASPPPPASTNRVSGERAVSPPAAGADRYGTHPRAAPPFSTRPKIAGPSMRTVRACAGPAESKHSASSTHRPRLLLVLSRLACGSNAHPPTCTEGRSGERATRLAKWQRGSCASQEVTEHERGGHTLTRELSTPRHRSSCCKRATLHARSPAAVSTPAVVRAPALLPRPGSFEAGRVVSRASASPSLSTAHTRHAAPLTLPPAAATPTPTWRALPPPPPPAPPPPADT
eukprot:scaffold18247_cov87-Isochrysis_galbana.AAC.2